MSPIAVQPLRELRHRTGAGMLDCRRALVRHVAEQVAAAPADALASEAALLEQPWIRDPSRTVGDLVTDVSGRVGEHVRVRRFTRFRLSDG